MHVLGCPFLLRGSYRLALSSAPGVASCKAVEVRSVLGGSYVPWPPKRRSGSEAGLQALPPRTARREAGGRWHHSTRTNHHSSLTPLEHQWLGGLNRSCWAHAAVARFFSQLTVLISMLPWPWAPLRIEHRSEARSPATKAGTKAPRRPSLLPPPPPGGGRFRRPPPGRGPPAPPLAGPRGRRQLPGGGVVPLATTP
jgi:hypothetical protein